MAATDDGDRAGCRMILVESHCQIGPSLKEVEMLLPDRPHSSTKRRLNDQVKLIQLLTKASVDSAGNVLQIARLPLLTAMANHKLKLYYQ